MENFSRFFYLLDQLSKTELKQFKKYLYMLNQNRYERSLLLVEAAQRLLINHKDTIQQANLKGEEALKLLINKFKRRVYKRLFVDKPYNSKEINNYMSDISLMIEEFMILLHLKKHKGKREEFLFEVSIERKMSKHIFMTLAKKKKYLETQPERSFWYNYELFKLHYYAYFRPEVPKNKGLAHEKTLQGLINTLQDFYIIGLLRITCEKITLARTGKYPYPTALIKHIKIYLKTYVSDNIPFQLYKTLLFFLETPNDDDFENIKTRVFKNISSFSVEEQNSWIGFLTNYYAFMINSTGENKYKILYVKTFTFSLKNIFSVNKTYISAGIFIGVYHIANKVDKAEATELLKYISALPRTEQKNAKLLCESFHFFDDNDFLNAHLTLQQIKYTNQGYLIRARVLQLKCYYEMRNENYNFMSPREYCVIFKKHLQTNQHLNKRLKLTIENLIKMVNLLTKFKPNVEEIKSQLEKTNSLGAKNWVIEKIRELE